MDGILDSTTINIVTKSTMGIIENVNISSGVYFYSIEAEDYHQLKR
jgi:hypothetical protein